eukprot:1166715-Pleurochrysis_carterae.AAC.1
MGIVGGARAGACRFFACINLATFVGLIDELISIVVVSCDAQFARIAAVKLLSARKQARQLLLCWLAQFNGL